MTGPWLLAFLALAALVLLMAVVQVGILRRVTVLLERAEAAVAAGGSGAGGDGLNPGARIAPFTASTIDGRRFDSDSVTGEAMWLLLSAGCGPCQVLAAELAGGSGERIGMPVVALVGAAGDAAELGLPAWVQVVVAADGIAMATFRTSSTPHAFASAGGVVKAQAIPNRLADLARLAARARGDATLPAAEPLPDLDELLLRHHAHAHDHQAP
jgi:hypothetical protein